MLNDFPPWAPTVLRINCSEIKEQYLEQFKVCSLFSHLGRPWITKKDYFEFWNRLLTNAEMESALNRICELKIGGGKYWSNNNSEDGFLLFEYMVNKALLIDNKNHLMTQDEKARWIKEVKDTARKLSRLIQNSHIDELLFYHSKAIEDDFLPQVIAERVGISEEKSKAAIEVFSTYRPLDKSSVMINELVSLIEMKDTTDDRNKKPNDEYFRRNYFIRSISTSFLTFTGNHQIETVTKIYNACFNESLSPKQVGRTAKKEASNQTEH